MFKLRNISALIGVVLLLAWAGLVVSDTTFEWSGTQNTGTLTYTSLGLVSPVISGATSIAGATTINGALTVTNGITVSAGGANITGTSSNTGAFQVIGALTATSYGGVTEANLVDKSASETITGAWNIGGTVAAPAAVTTLSVSSTVTLTDTQAVGSVTPEATNAPALVATDTAAWVKVTIGGEIYVIPAYQLDD